MLCDDPKFIVGIGGSAGGLKAYLALLDALPSHTGMAFVVIAHMSPTGENLLAQILSRATSMPVAQATEGMAVKSNHLYVIPPNANLSVESYTFKVVSPRTMNNGRHKQVDHFLISLAELMGARAISIIFSGGDGDGTEGSKRIKAKGGITFAQDLSADVDSMPLHAQASGCIDFVLAPKKISEELTKIGANFKEKQTMNSNSLVGVNVLRVDDSPDSLALLTIVLKRSGANVTSCTSGEDALRETGAHRFHVIISDLNMPPGMDGYDLAHALRANEKADGMDSTPTVAVSGDANTPSAKRRFADFQVYMTKPFDQKHLVNVVERLAEANGDAVEAGTLALYDADKRALAALQATTT